VLKAILSKIKGAPSPALTPFGKQVLEADLKQGVPADDPGCEAVIQAGLNWLGAAQDHSRTLDGGVARHYSLIDGWSSSYPETTGYIIPTLLECAQRYQRPDLRDRALRMLNWFREIQLPGGGFQGGMVDATPVVPVTFNTGQILMGLAAAAGDAELKETYLPVMRAAADWLAKTQDPDGCWRKHSTPFAEPGEKTYETHVSWGLFEAARVDETRGYADAALRQVHWALKNQMANGWLRDCCLDQPTRPLTHTLGYALRGILEAYRFTKEKTLLDAAVRTANGLMTAINDEGRLPGRLNANWKPTVDWVCLTGASQIAHSWFMLYKFTGEKKYLNAGRAANRFVRRTVVVDGSVEIRGGVKGSFPVSGDYGRFQYLNWACKFTIDSNLVELQTEA
jgi:hypothetical protein